MRGPSDSSPNAMGDPGFDMRLKYYDSLGKLFEVIGYTGANNLVNAQIYAVASLLDLVSPFIDQNTVLILDQQLQLIHAMNLKVEASKQHRDQALRMQAMSDEFKLRRDIGHVTRSLLAAMAQKKMLLPIRAVDDDVNDTELARSMGL